LPPNLTHERNRNQGDGAPAEALRELSNLFRGKGNGGSRTGALPLDNEGPPAEVKYRIGPHMTPWTPDLGL
jgi:hypothetical protein